MKAEPKTIKAIEDLFKQWEDQINNSSYADKAKETYIRYPKMFLRWCKDEFTSDKFYDQK